jgi:hypothetical protein
MRYFSPERYLAMQNPEPEAMNAADAAWEEAVEQYDAYLLSIVPELPVTVRNLLDGFYLHDARVLSIGQRDDTFFISLQLDVPPRDLLTITYALAGTPEIDKRAFPPPGGEHALLWLYEEIEFTREAERPYFAHDILLSNGWVLRIPFSDAQLQVAEPVYAGTIARAGGGGYGRSVAGSLPA